MPPGSGRRSRPYAATGGRVQALDGDLRPDTQVTAQTGGTHGPLTAQHSELLGLCRAPRAVAELASGMDLPLGVVTLLVDELHRRGQVATRAPYDMGPDTTVTHALMERVAAKLRESLRCDVAQEADEEGEKHAN
ncbi:DUF742 domain-containing protein [Streptomyces sp. SBT349]|uniref:DUF742 domain-containing protein n=1 Tax=Streptomyces sp. SBT349 TaxID=1580539 RepID=UPI00066AEBE7|nr:DUF742 domain-containing protein [Streptomyces sp. SBT349]